MNESINAIQVVKPSQGVWAAARIHLGRGRRFGYSKGLPAVKSFRIFGMGCACNQWAAHCGENAIHFSSLWLVTARPRSKFRRAVHCSVSPAAWFSHCRLLLSCVICSPFHSSSSIFHRNSRLCPCALTRKIAAWQLQLVLPYHMCGVLVHSINSIPHHLHPKSINSSSFYRN